MLIINIEFEELEEKEEQDFEIDLEDWNLAISSNYNPQPTFVDFINVDDDFIVSGEFTEHDVVHAFSSSSLENEEDDDEMDSEEFSAPNIFYLIYFIKNSRDVSLAMKDIAADCDLNDS
ncbi:unnamed protein product [Arctia plantaginis]|uniref:Uncharacterized protein n=1 Tax=Arctia plantaginis TaxID=874455 RepID=A0A8S0YV33_ARCPL|nr:unnamed protein product [Arctia plantaginis]